MYLKNRELFELQITFDELEKVFDFPPAPNQGKCGIPVVVKRIRSVSDITVLYNYQDMI